VESSAWQRGRQYIANRWPFLSLRLTVLGPQFNVHLILFIPSLDGLAVVSHFLFSTTSLLVTG